ncbi:MAG: WD40/YVTN/BNR-like repeat-containing protein [bacterium]
MKTQKLLKTILIILLLAVSSLLYASDWECITTDLWKQIPDYEDGPNHFVRKSGTLLVNPETGQLFLLVSPKYGIWTSTDQGKSWKRSDDNVVSGRTWGGDGAQFDPNDYNRMAFFTIVGKGATPIGGISLDGGKSWQAFHKPQGMRHDGWTSGQVDWRDKEPKTIFAKQHHTENLWITRDLGKSWEQVTLEGGAYKLGMFDDDAFVAAPKGNEGLVPILRSTDQGKTWTQVYDPVFLMQRHPHVRGKNGYWAIDNSILVTNDKGATWKPMDPIVRDVPEGEVTRTWGPIFGRSEDEMLFAAKGHGYFRSIDRGKSWTKIANWMENATEFDKAREAFSIGWDLDRKLVYCAFLGGETYKTNWLEAAE